MAMCGDPSCIVTYIIQTVSEKTECGCNNIPFLRSRDSARVSTAKKKKHETRPWGVTHRRRFSRSYAEKRFYVRTRGKREKVSLEPFDSLGNGTPWFIVTWRKTRGEGGRLEGFVSNGPRHFCHKVINKRHSVIATVQPWLIRPSRAFEIQMREARKRIDGGSWKRGAYFYIDDDTSSRASVNFNSIFRFSNLTREQSKSTDHLGFILWKLSGESGLISWISCRNFQSIISNSEEMRKSPTFGRCSFKTHLFFVYRWTFDVRNKETNHIRSAKATCHVLLTIKVYLFHVHDSFVALLQRLSYNSESLEKLQSYKSIGIIEI